MKKLLALLLALTIALSLASVGLAAHVDEYTLTNAGQSCENQEHHLQPGESYAVLEYEHHGSAPNEYVGFVSEGDLMQDWNTGIPFVFADSDYSGTTDIDALFATHASNISVPDGMVNSAHEGTVGYKVSVEWSVGGAMVESLKFVKKPNTGDEKSDRHGMIMLKLNENYTIDSPKDLIGTVTLEEGQDTVKLYINAKVSNHLVIIDGYSKLADAADDAIEAFDNTIYKCSEDEPGYVVFNANNRLFSTTLKMIKNEKAFMFNNEDMIDAVEEMYGNLDADIECYQFGGSPTFTNDAAFTLQADYADQYFVYEWDGKSLTKVDYEWDSINGMYKWATKSPTDYVISDKELVMADEEVDKNPDTGANDVVGVAAALVVVSLIAAGAVSLKK